MADNVPVPVIDDGVARNEVTVTFSHPIEVTDFTRTLNGFAREYQETSKRELGQSSGHETKLVIMDVRKGSIILELAPWLLPIIAEYDKIKPAIDFLKDLASAYNLLKLPGGRLPDPTTQRLKNLGDTVRAIVGDSDGAIKIAARHKEKGLLQEIVVTKDDAVAIEQNASRQRKEIEARTAVDLPGVVMRLHQSSVAEPSVGKKTSEKGVIERYDMTPRPLIYASENAAQRIKGVIAEAGDNPYKKLFVVDVDVEIAGGVARAYRILDVKDVLDIEDEE